MLESTRKDHRVENCSQGALGNAQPVPSIWKYLVPQSSTCPGTELSERWLQWSHSHTSRQYKKARRRRHWRAAIRRKQSGVESFSAKTKLAHHSLNTC